MKQIARLVLSICLLAVALAPAQVPLTRQGVLAHVASGGLWTTEIVLVNPYNISVQINVLFYGDDGSPLTLPLVVTQNGTQDPFSASHVLRVMEGRTTLKIDTTSPNGPIQQGWADVQATGAINGFAFFSEPGPGGVALMGTVPLQTQYQDTMVISFDNTKASNGTTQLLSAVALANPTSAGADFAVTIYDLSGNKIGSGDVGLLPNGHKALVLQDQFFITGNQAGFVMFKSLSGSPILGLGLRFATPDGTFTSIPSILPSITAGPL